MQAKVAKLPRANQRHKMFMYIQAQRFLDHRLAGMPDDGFAGGITQANDFVPVRGIVRGGMRKERWRESDGHRSRTGKSRSVAQELARTGERDRNDWCAGNHGGVESTELKWPNAIFGNKRAFRKNKNGLALAKNCFHLLHGVAAGIGIVTDERKMVHLAKKGADERHAVDFILGHKSIGHAEAHHQRQHVEKTGVIGSVNFGSQGVHMLFANYANASARQKEKDFQCR